MKKHNTSTDFHQILDQLGKLRELYETKFPYKVDLSESEIYIIRLALLKRLYKSTRAVILLATNGLEQDCTYITRGMFEVTMDLFILDRYPKTISLYLDCPNDLYNLSNNDKRERKDIIHRALNFSVEKQKIDTTKNWIGLSMRNKLKIFGWEDLYSKFYIIHSDYSHNKHYLNQSYYEQVNDNIFLFSKNPSRTDSKEMRYFLFIMALLDALNLFLAGMLVISESSNIAQEELIEYQKNIKDIDFVIKPYLDKYFK